MKVSLSPINVTTNSKLYNQRKLVNNTNSHAQKATNTTLLSNYYYNSQVSFGSNENGDKKPKTKVEVKAKKLEIQKRNEALKKELEEAKEYINNKWSNWDICYDKAEKECDKLPWYKWSEKSRIRQVWSDSFEKKVRDAEATIAKEKLINDLVAGNDIDAEKLGEMERGLAASEARAKMLSVEGGMDNRIAGYQWVKNDLEKRFLNPLADEAAGIKTPVPPCVALYGATGTGKTTFVNALAHQSGAYVDPLETDSNMFQTEIQKRVQEAARRYHDPKTKGQRTIILINEVEDFLSEDPKNKANVRCFKSKLDTISEIPLNAEDKIRGAATIFVTTNSPHLIHPHLRIREGKMGEFIAVNPPEKADMMDVLKFYVKKAADAITLREDADKFNITPDEVPYDKIAENKQPTSDLGAYSNDKLEKIVQKALDNYISEPKKPFKTHLSFVFSETKRDIFPELYNEFVRIYKMIAPIQLSEFDKLKEAEEMGCLEEAGLERLKYFQKIFNAEKIAKTVAGTAIDVAKKVL